MTRAISDYTKVLTINPRFDETYFNRARALFQKGAVREALVDSKTALKLNPEHKDYQKLVDFLENQPN